MLLKEIKNWLYKKKRKIYNFPKQFFQKTLWEKNMDNLYLLEAAILGNERIRGGGRIRVCKVDCPGFIN